MMDMGFPRAHAELALEETGNVGVEVATEWLCSVPDHVLKQHLEERSSSGDRRMSSMREELMRALLPRRVPLKVCTGGRDRLDRELQQDSGGVLQKMTELAQADFGSYSKLQGLLLSEARC